MRKTPALALMTCFGLSTGCMAVSATDNSVGGDVQIAVVQDQIYLVDVHTRKAHRVEIEVEDQTAQGKPSAGESMNEIEK